MWQKEVSNERIESQGLSDGLLPHIARIAHQITEKSALLKGPKGRFGRLQRQCNRAFSAVAGAALTTQELASWCWPRQWMCRPLKRWQIDNQARAAKSIGARPMERVGVQRVWRLKSD
jgi:hypothetical protein